MIEQGDPVKSPHGIGVIGLPHGNLGGYWWVHHTDGLARWYAEHNLQKLHARTQTRVVDGVETVDLAGGKYTVINRDGHLSALRYGEPWRDLVGDNLVYWMMVRIQELEAELTTTERTSS